MRAKAANKEKYELTKVKAFLCRRGVCAKMEVYNEAKLLDKIGLLGKLRVQSQT